MAEAEEAMHVEQLLSAISEGITDGVRAVAAAAEVAALRRARPDAVAAQLHGAMCTHLVTAPHTQNDDRL